MTKIHTIPLNMGDFQRDIFEMDAREVGAYMLLLVAHMQSGKQGLPNDDKKLAQIARVTPTVWKNRLKNRIMDKFIPIFDEENDPDNYRFINETCIEMIEKIEQKSAVNSANALKRKDRGHANAQRRHSEHNAIQRQSTNTKPNNLYREYPKSGEAELVEFKPPKEEWKKALLKKHGQAIYVSWFQDLFLDNGYVFCSGEHKMQRCKNDFGKDIIEAIGEEFKGFKVSHKTTGYEKYAV